MLWRLRNRLWYSETYFKRFEGNHVIYYSSLRKQNSIKNSKIGSANNPFSCNPTLRRAAEKFDEKFVTLLNNDYSKLSIESTYFSENVGILYLNFKEADNLEFPVIWLRDNCQCPECFDIVANSRVHAPLSFANDVVLQSVKLTEDSVTVIWKDGHESVFRKDWLCQHSFQAEHQIERLNNHYTKQISWNCKDFKNFLPNICFKFDDISNDDNFLLKWLETLAAYGIAKIFGASLESGQLVKLINRISFIRKTHYGEEYSIRGSNDANNVAYKKGPLQMHTDLPYYQYVPGVVFLHFVVQSCEGGENILADGLNAVKQLPKRMYDTLSTTLVDWVDRGSENNNKFYSMYRAPVICKNYLGEIERINWSQPQRDSSFNVSAKRAVEWYGAFREFTRIIHDRENAVTIKSDKGSILTFDNRRILHGRTDYSDNNRLLYGAYADWDEIYSKIRVLREDLKVNEKINVKNNFKIF